MIIQNELKKTQRLIKGNVAYFDPSHNSSLNLSIHILPLLIDKVCLYINKNNKGQKPLTDSCLDLIDEKLIIPVSLSEKNIPNNLQIKQGIFRDKLFDESLFDIDYKTAIEKDYGDEELKDLVKKKLCKNGSDFDKNFCKMAYSFNWSLIFSQVLNVPLIMDSKHQSIASYKCRGLVDSYYYPQSLNNIIPVRNFISTINPLLPSNLDADKIKSFRKEKIAIKFRNWLEKSIYDVYSKQKYGLIDVDKYLIKEFNEMSSNYSTKTNLISYSISGALGGLVGYAATGSLAGAGFSGAIGTAASYPLSKCIKEIWKKKGPNPWIFLLNEVK